MDPLMAKRMTRARRPERAAMSPRAARLPSTLLAEFFPLPCARASGIPRGSNKSFGRVLRFALTFRVRRDPPVARDRC